MLDPEDNEFTYLGAVRWNEKWRFFHEERDLWVLNLTDYDFIPEARKNSIVIDSNIDDYIAAMTTEVQPHEIAAVFPKVPLTYVVNFDSKLFIDGVPQEGFNAINEFVPVAWKSVESVPYFFIPADLRPLWLNHLLHQQGGWAGMLEIPEYSSVCAIHYQNTWRFFYELPATWILDFESFINRSNVSFLADEIYANWRGDLKIVDSYNAEQYLKLLEPHEIEPGQVSGLIYTLYMLGRRISKKQSVSRIIDFDKKLVINEGSFDPKTKKRIGVKFIPSGWQSIVGNPYDYLPASLRGL